MQAVATRWRPVAAGESPVTEAAQCPAPDAALCDVIRARSVLLGDRAYLEHARDDHMILSFRQLEERMDRWRSLLSGLRARGLTTVGLVVADPMAFADAFLGAVSAGFWVAPLDPSLPVSGGGGLAAALARAGVDVVLADRPAPSGVDGVWIELDRLEHMEEGPATRPGATAPPRAGRGCRVVLVGHDRDAQSGSIEPGQAAPHGARCGDTPGAGPRGPRLQPAAAVPHQRRGGGPSLDVGRRFQSRPRRPVPPERLLGPDGPPFDHVDQRSARHRLAPERARAGRDRAPAASGSSARPRRRCRRWWRTGSRRARGSRSWRPTA